LLTLPRDFFGGRGVLHDYTEQDGKFIEALLWEGDLMSVSGTEAEIKEATVASHDHAHAPAQTDAGA
jgi:hypothetical protein